ncbi:MAG: DUF4375 domain-containing protein [Clostridia bacterium]|nr:DUF4375 domain-containing protein [Clostridia bacterium]
MEIIKKIITAAVIATVLLFVVGFAVSAALDLFGNPVDKKNVERVAEKYVSENYSGMNPVIVDVDYDAKYVGYQVEVYLEETKKTFWLHYYVSGELEWDTYDFCIYEEKFAKAYYEDGLYGIRDVIGEAENEKQKAVLAVINFDSEIQNGGLCQYLVNEDNENIIKITEYLRTVGAHEQAALLDTFAAENGLELKSVEIGNSNEYSEFENSMPFDEFDNAYMDLYTPDEEWKPDFSGIVVSYIQDNIEDF